MTAKKNPPANPVERARNVALFGMDVDGVLTDGRLTFDVTGREIKSFHVRDGHGVVMARHVGLPIVALSGRRSRITAMRLTEWRIDSFHQKIGEKEPLMDRLLSERKLDWSQLAYIADDVVDLRIFKRCGLAMAPSDAAVEMREAAHWISTCRGGEGCVREALEFILRAQGRWEEAMKRYA